MTGVCNCVRPEGTGPCAMCQQQMQQEGRDTFPPWYGPRPYIRPPMPPWSPAPPPTIPYLEPLPGETTEALIRRVIREELARVLEDR